MRTAPLGQATLRTAWLSLSATYTVFVEGSKSSPCGELNCALEPTPPAVPAAPLPARVVVAPPALT